MIEVTNLSKRYGSKLAVDDLSFTVRPGVVTGFLGPNGSGKSTTMRMILGLDQPTSGTALVNGRPMAQHGSPLHTIGALLDAKGLHPGRTARNHLRALAATHGLPAARADEVLAQVGLTGVANKRAGSFSLGMGQRLGIAAALLGDPEVVMLDEPVNGLDPEGIVWIRHMMRGLADEGRTVFVSSHLMNEMALMANELVVIGQGRLIAQTSMQELVEASSQAYISIRAPQSATLASEIIRLGGDVTTEDDCLHAAGVSAQQIGDLALDLRIPIHELAPHQASLEDAFMELTHETVEYNPTNSQERAA